MQISKQVDSTESGSMRNALEKIAACSEGEVILVEDEAALRSMVSSPRQVVLLGSPDDSSFTQRLRDFVGRKKEPGLVQDLVEATDLDFLVPAVADVEHARAVRAAGRRKISMKKETRMIKRDRSGKIVEFEDDSAAQLGQASSAKMIASGGAPSGNADPPDEASAVRKRIADELRQVEREIMDEVSVLDRARLSCRREIDVLYGEALQLADRQREEARERAERAKLDGRRVASDKFNADAKVLHSRLLAARADAARRLEAELARVELAGLSVPPGGGS
jgi:hypothetical protein